MPTSVERAINRPPSLAVPAAANPESTLSAVLSPGESRRIEVPGERIAATERTGQGGHA